MKFERQNADFDYNRMVVISDLRPQREADSQLAMLAGNPTSAFAIQLSASIDARTPTAELGVQAGVDATGATECAAAIQTALDGMAALGVRAHARGTFKIGSTVKITGAADLGDAVFNYTGGVGVAVQVGSGVSGTPGILFRQRIVLPEVNNTGKTGTGWTAGTVGVKIVNAYRCVIELGHTQGFETNLWLRGVGTGCTYNSIRGGHLDNGKINLLLSCDTTGWCNENNFFGGSLSHNSGEGAAVAGTRHVRMERDAGAVNAGPNNNRFYGVALESPGVVEYVVDVNSGSWNQFIGCRWEYTGGQTPIRWGAEASRNVISGGYNSDNLIETWVSGAGTNSVYSATQSREMMSSTTGGHVFENSHSSTAAAITVMRAGGIEAGDAPATAYQFKMSAQAAAGKRSTDSFPRVQLDFTNGALTAGDGTAAPQVSFRPSGSNWYLIGGMQWETDGVSDVGAGTKRPRDVFVGRNVDIGQWARSLVYRDVPITPTFAATQSINFATGQRALLTLTGNITSLSFTGGTADGLYEVHFIQDGTGSRTLAGTSAAIKWAGGAPTLSTGAGKRDIFRFRYDGASWFEVSRSMNVG